jgi:phage/conjugal plasmid C-4 type zinc finger TraR family protein
MDTIDMAQEREDLDRDLALREHRSKFAPLFDADPECMTARECLECGDEIPPERRRAVPGTFYCVECQRLAEREEQLFG